MHLNSNSQIAKENIIVLNMLCFVSVCKIHINIFLISDF
jgi:hypothetical protein